MMATKRCSLRAVWPGAAVGRGVMVALLAACGNRTGPAPAQAPVTRTAPDTTAVGLALEIDSGKGVPLSVMAGQTFYIDQIDLRAAIAGDADHGVDELTRAGDLASLDWSGVTFEEQGPPVANGDGTFTRRRFYRGARWMKTSSTFTITPVDGAGKEVAEAVTLAIGEDDRRAPGDGFFVRRLRAIQWTRDCASATSCAGATKFEAEALVEVRHALEPRATLSLPATAQALRVAWSLQDTAYTIPLSQVSSPEYGYGFVIDVEAVTPPGPQGFYAPGQDVTFQVSLRDGAGKRLHAAGSLPTYNEVIFKGHAGGIQYYRGFFDPSATYWRRKHRESLLAAQIIGPAQDIQPIRSVIDLARFLGPDDVQTMGTPARDGVFAQTRIIPPANVVFGGAFDPAHAAWDAPVSDRFTFHLADDAAAGTYLVTVKGRRVYLGQSIPYSRTVEIQVGTSTATRARLDTGPCTSCHAGGGELSRVLHGNDNRAACAGCHAPLSFELEGPIAVRVHFIHSRSHRVGAEAIKRCGTCHIGAASIQRTSLAACMSCHTGYPADHVAEFGAVTDIYVGDGPESFGQCTDSCHGSHPGSGL